MIGSRSLATLLCAALVVGVSTDLDAQKIYYVDGSVSSSGDGSTWAKAFKTVQEALTKAASKNEIWVAKGNYVGNFKVKAGLKLYGGFESGDFRKSQARPWVNVTALDANNSGRVCELEKEVLLDGFTVRRGKAKIPGGGGMLILGVAPVIRNCRFLDNNLSSGRGHAVCVGPRLGAHGRPLFENCEFVNNGNNGTPSGTHCFDIEVASPIVRNITLRNNAGDGFHYRAGANPQMINAIFADNTGHGVAASDSTSKNPIFESILFWNNKKGMFDNHGKLVNKIADINKLSFYKNCVAGDVKWVMGQPGVPSNNSAAVDKGKNIYLAHPTDLNGNSRRLDGNNDFSPTTDIGAVEASRIRLSYTGNPTPGGTVNIVTSGVTGTPVIMAAGLQAYAKPILFLHLGYLQLDTATNALISVWQPVGKAVPLAVPKTWPKGLAILFQGVAGTAQWTDLSNMLDVRLR